MVIYEQEIKERLKSENASPAERFRSDICEAAAKAMPQVTVFYSAREQGTKRPAVFSRTEKLTVCKRLGATERVTMTIVLRYLPERAADDAENERFIEAMSDAARSIGSVVTVFSAQRTDMGAKVMLTLCFEQETVLKDSGGVMRILEMNRQ